MCSPDCRPAAIGPRETKSPGVEKFDGDRLKPNLRSKEGVDDLKPATVALPFG